VLRAELADLGLSKLIEAANRVCESDRRQPELVVLRRVSIA
jgi:hypothetical protein